MEFVVTKAELGKNRTALIAVAPRAILVSYDDKACLAHNRWFDKDTARNMIRALEAFVDGDT